MCLISPVTFYKSKSRYQRTIDAEHDGMVILVLA